MPTNDLVFFRDDFDTILGILEDEEELDIQFGEAGNEVSITFILSDPKLTFIIFQLDRLSSRIIGAAFL